eukprot:1482974-Rhodomonas_salina.1
MFPNNRVPVGSSSISIEGGNFGLQAYTQRARSGNTACEASRWESDTSLRCLTGPGVGGTKRIQVTSGEQVGTGSVFYSFDDPSLSVLRRANKPATGSVSVTIQGQNYGQIDYTDHSRIGHTGTEATDWESDTSLRCQAAHGIRSTRRLAVTAGVQVGTLTQAMSNDVAAVSNVRRTNRPGTGSASITVQAGNFGHLQFTQQEIAGHTQCEASEWESETSM